MTEREQFEAWFSDNGQYPKAIERNGDTYKLSTAYAAWQAWQPAWQASRRAALDHCTDVLANVAAHGGDMTAAIGLIRALSQKDPQ